MEELRDQLLNVSDSYFDFVIGVMEYAKKKESRLKNMLAYIGNHPNAVSSDIIRFMSDQPDFYEDVVTDEAPINVN